MRRDGGHAMASTKDITETTACILITVVALVVGVSHSLFAISINAGRVSDLQSLEARIQAQVGKIALDPKSIELNKMIQTLTTLNADRDKLRDEINKGNRGSDPELSSHPVLYCLVPTDPNCFHRNASETNNLHLAMASGVLGACLLLFLRFRDQAIGRKLEAGGSVVYVLSLLASGVIFGLLIVYLLRGTKGALLTPVANVIQVENPYGIAFACVVAAFFSDRVVAWLYGLVNPATLKSLTASEKS